MSTSLHTSWKELNRRAANRAACRYIVKHFQWSRKRHFRSIYSLKHDFERATEYYICEDDYATCLRQCGFKVKDGKVYAKEKV